MSSGSSELVIEGLRATVDGREILKGVDLTVRSGEVHVVMGPNGSGKSTLAHVLMGRPGYEAVSGSVRLDGTELLGLAAHERAHAGLFLAMQYPIEVPGVSLDEALGEAVAAGGGQLDLEGRLGEEARRLGIEERFLHRALNVDLSGGEKKRNETLQLAVLRPRIAVLDEIDSGLDIDALSAVSRRVEDLTNEAGLGVLAITHYSRLLSVLRADQVHVLLDGEIVKRGGPEVADELEQTGYAAFKETPVAIGGVMRRTVGPDTGSDDPFADPLA